MTPLSLMATRAKHSPQVIYNPLTTSLMSEWLAICQENHRNYCVRSPGPSDSIDGRPLWLYDLDNECLVAGDGVKQYAALSYVWDQVRMLQTVKANVRAFSRPHELVAAALPSTIRNAAWLATSIGIKHLWVDSLCHVQDDAEKKHAQIEQTASIYANAFSTLIPAMGGDTNAGIGVSQTFRFNLLFDSQHNIPKPGFN
jgi:hypothetical protein